MSSSTSHVARLQAHFRSPAGQHASGQRALVQVSDDGGLTIDESVVPVLARDAQFVAALFEAMVSLNPGLSPDEVLARLTR